MTESTRIPFEFLIAYLDAGYREQEARVCYPAHSRNEALMNLLKDWDELKSSRKIQTIHVMYPQQ